MQAQQQHSGSSGQLASSQMQPELVPRQPHLFLPPPQGHLQPSLACTSGSDGGSPTKTEMHPPALGFSAAAHGNEMMAGDAQGA
ncbi:hypothetical protein, partial [Klebsiella pneumoniae]|uniref:hypothetical protein n=1 Tax=Klebsiella pneumoniae TaxID=573 RepID=UPI0025A06A3E